MADILYATGAVHDEAGPVTSFAPLTELGREWIDAHGADGTYVIETYMEDHTIACMMADSLTVARA